MSFNFEHTELPAGNPDRDSWQDVEYLMCILGWR